jgi:hypothetical protein
MAVVNINGDGLSQGGYLDPDYQSVIIDEDYVCGALTSTCTPATATNSGATAFAGMNGRLGVVSLTTGTVSATGACAMGTNANVISFYDGLFMSFEAETYILNNLSTAGEDYTLISGYGDVLTVAGQSDGIYFRYNHALNGGKWQLVCEKAGVETTLDSGVLVAVNIWYNLKIETYGHDSATFYINDINVGTINTGLPSDSDYTGINVGIFKSVGTSTRAYRVDWMYLYASHGNR